MCGAASKSSYVAAARNGSRARVLGRVCELAPQVGEQGRLAAAAGRPQGAHELGVRERADVVEVERVLARLGPLHPGGDPARSARVAERLRGQGQLGGAELEVVVPRGLRIERVRERGDDLHVLGPGGAVDRRGRRQLLPRPGGLRGRVELGGERERRGGPPGEVGWERRAGRIGAEHGPVADVAVGPALQAVVRLRQPPQVVIADERALGVARANADLQEHAPVGLPRLVEPVEPEARLGLQRRRRRTAELAPGDEQQRGRVGGGVRELDEVAGVHPAALDIDRPADPLQRGAEDHVAVRTVVTGRRVHRSVGVVEVGGAAVQRTGDHVRAVALRLEELDRLADPRHEQAVGDAEARRRRAGRAEPVRAGRAQLRQVERLDGPVAAVPPPAIVPGTSAQDDLARGVDDHEPGVRARRDQIRHLVLARREAELVDPDRRPVARRRPRREHEQQRDHRDLVRDLYSNGLQATHSEAARQLRRAPAAASAKRSPAPPTRRSRG